MARKPFTPEIFQYVFDACALINIQHKVGIRMLEKRKGSILISERVKWEVAEHPKIPSSDALKRFVLKNPDIVTQFQDNEEEEYLRISQQKGIDPGEASVIAIASKRRLPLVIDERNTKATGKAKNHGITTLSWQEFLKLS